MTSYNNGRMIDVCEMCMIIYVCCVWDDGTFASGYPCEEKEKTRRENKRLCVSRLLEEKQPVFWWDGFFHLAIICNKSQFMCV